jgi:hypothetical protein
VQLLGWLGHLCPPAVASGLEQFELLCLSAVGSAKTPQLVIIVWIGVVDTVGVVTCAKNSAVLLDSRLPSKHLFCSVAGTDRYRVSNVF